MSDYDIARALYETLSRQAQATRAYRRVQVLRTNADGSVDVNYEGGEVTLMPPSGGTYPAKSWADAVYSDGVLSLDSPSAYGGGNDSPA